MPFLTDQPKGQDICQEMMSSSLSLPQQRLGKPSAWWLPSNFKRHSSRPPAAPADQENEKRQAGAATKRPTLKRPTMQRTAPKLSPKPDDVDSSPHSTQTFHSAPVSGQVSLLIDPSLAKFEILTLVFSRPQRPCSVLQHNKHTFCMKRGSSRKN